MDIFAWYSHLRRIWEGFSMWDIFTFLNSYFWKSMYLWQQFKFLLLIFSGGCVDCLVWFISLLWLTVPNTSWRELQYNRTFMRMYIVLCRSGYDQFRSFWWWNIVIWNWKESKNYRQSRSGISRVAFLQFSVTLLARSQLFLAARIHAKSYRKTNYAASIG